MKRSRLYPWKTSSSFGLKYDPIMRKNEIIRAAKALHAAKVGIYSLRQSFLLAFMPERLWLDLQHLQVCSLYEVWKLYLVFLIREYSMRTILFFEKFY